MTSKHVPGVVRPAKVATPATQDWIAEVQARLPHSAGTVTDPLERMSDQTLTALNESFEHPDGAADAVRLQAAQNLIAPSLHQQFGARYAPGVGLLDSGLRNLAMQNDLDVLQRAKLIPERPGARARDTGARITAAASTFVAELGKATGERPERLTRDLVAVEPEDRFTRAAELLVKTDRAGAKLSDSQLTAARDALAKEISGLYFPEPPLPSSDYDLHVTAGGAIQSAHRLVGSEVTKAATRPADAAPGAAVRFLDGQAAPHPYPQSDASGAVNPNASSAARPTPRRRHEPGHDGLG